MQIHRLPDSRSIAVADLPLRASAPATPEAMRIQGASEGFELLAAEGDDTGGSQKLRKFSMVAYTGAAMSVGFGWPVVVDLAGMTTPSQSRPILKAHDVDAIVGHTSSIEVSAQRIKVAGVISGVGDAAQEVVALAANGFPWQASIGATIQKMEFVDRGETVKVNGRSFTGPIYVARQTVLGEVSFVPMGADAGTSANVAATQHGDPTMFEKWLLANGFDPKTITDAQRVALQAAFDATQKPPVDPPKPPDGPTITETMRREASVEAARQLEIRKACPNVALECEVEEGGVKRRVSIQAHALAAGWTRDQTELAVLRAERAVAPLITNNGPALTTELKAEAIEAGILCALGMPDVEKQFKPDVMEASRRHYRNIGLQQVILMAAIQNGFHCQAGQRIHGGNVREVLHFAFPPIQAAASSVSLPGILGNVANKELLSGYMEEDQSWREVAAIKSVNNFFAVTSYRMLDSMEYEEVGPSGEIKHGSVDQESYTRQASTFAKMFALTRRDIINDDLSAFDDLRSRLGRGSAKKFNNVFWTKFLYDHATFFTSTRTNYITGATTNLGTDGVGVGLGIKAFRQMRSPSADGSKRVGGNPEILVVPPELEGNAEVTYRNQNLGSVKNSDANIYQNKYRPVVVPWLSDSAFTGYSTTAWYLLRNPKDLAMMVASFLNGMQAPTVEMAEADFDTLGVQFRGYHDFGCDQAEYLAGIKSKGAA